MEAQAEVMLFGVHVLFIGLWVELTNNHCEQFPGSDVIMSTQMATSFMLDIIIHCLFDILFQKEVDVANLGDTQKFDH